MNKYYNFKIIYIENKVKNHKNTENILSKISGNPEINYFDNIIDLIKKSPDVYHPKDRSKILTLSSIRGEVLKKCPGTCGHICCNYYVVNLYIGCPLNCSYCILQAYLNQPFTIINVDIENIFDGIKNIVTENNDKIFRIGTGELGDSLVYDRLTGFSNRFIDFFSDFKNCIFEFKTKTDFIENIIKQKSPGNIVTGFSVNPQIIIDKDESNTVSLDKRISAMEKLINEGYKISLHFDPIVNITDFENQYKNVIDKIFSKIKPEDIAWISLGTFRYIPELKTMMEYNYPESDLLDDEFLEDHDKKLRYFKPIRLKLYNTIIQYLKEKSDKMLIYLCMESPDIWENTLSFLPSKEKKMDLLFKNAMILKS
jgi:spore photoproduct lyase